MSEVVGQIVGLMLGQGAWRSLADATRRIDQADPLLAMLGCIMLGAAFGGLSGLLVPHRLVPNPPIPGLSVPLAPIVTGTLVHVYGQTRRRPGQRSSWLTTFPGAGIFAFAFAIVRLLIVH